MEPVAAANRSQASRDSKIETEEDIKEARINVAHKYLQLDRERKTQPFNIKQVFDLKNQSQMPGSKPV